MTTVLPYPRTADPADPDGYTPVLSLDRRWEYERISYEQLRVTHVASGLRRDYYGGTTLDDVVNGHVPSGRMEADFRAIVMHLLGHPASRPEDRAAAGKAVIALEMVDSECVCGGYLTLAPGRRLMHLDLCRWCVADPEACAEGHEVKRMCPDPMPVQCGHNCYARAGYAATRACGSDKDCCGRHGCDTAISA